MNDSPPFDIETFNLTVALKHLPVLPGVYQMYTHDHTLLYVGKAKNLKNRVRSYFQNKAHHHTPRISSMVRQVAYFKTIITDSEMEALILESTLIKKHQPKYNVLLKDDKKFPWIGINHEPFPRLFITRSPQKNPKVRHFGPYINSGEMYAILQVIRKHFPLRQRRKPLFKTRPCMNYFIGACLAPCQKMVSPEAYAEVVHQVELFLKGNADELKELIVRDMLTASEALNFEYAAKLRNRLQAVEGIIANQKMVSDDTSLNQDILAIAVGHGMALLTILKVRKGKMISSASKSLDAAVVEETQPQEAYSDLLFAYYQDLPEEEFPDEILLHYPLEDQALLTDWMQDKRRKRVKLIAPQRGQKLELIKLAEKNAAKTLEQLFMFEQAKHQRDPVQALLDLQEALNLPEFPARMECYDISHFQGSQTGASMVVFTDGIPDKAAYRRFKIRVAEGKPDDFESMAEVIRRRVSHWGEAGWEEPDLIIIDGGKGQLSHAVQVLRDSGLINQPIISLAKRYEEVFLPDQSIPVILPRDSKALFLLQQIRDEAHRFAITHHRQRRNKQAMISALDEIPGVGPKTREKLIQAFGTVPNIAQQTAQTLMQKAGISGKLAMQILDTLKV